MDKLIKALPLWQGTIGSLESQKWLFDFLHTPDFPKHLGNQDKQVN